MSSEDGEKKKTYEEKKYHEKGGVQDLQRRDTLSIKAQAEIGQRKRGKFNVRSVTSTDTNVLRRNRRRSILLRAGRVTGVLSFRKSGINI